MKEVKTGISKKAPKKPAGQKNTVQKQTNERAEFPPIFLKERIDEKSKFELAKYVLLTVVLIYIFLVATVLYIDAADYLREVWAVTICLINTVAGMIIGYYFRSAKHP